MQALVLTIHILACLILIVLVLLQSGKEDMGVIFGGGSSSVFGSSGAGGVLVKITAGAATVFLITSLIYNNLSGTKFVDEDSVMLKGDGVFEPMPEEDQKPKGIQFERTDEPAKGAETSDAGAAAPKPAETKE